MKKQFKLLAILLSIIFVVSLCMNEMSIPVSASEEKKTVRVGVYPLEGFHSFGADGNCEGYDVDYLNKIAGYTGWNYEFVEAESWSNAIDLLRNNEIDILAPSQITTKRLEEFSFSSFPIGKVYAAILALDNNETIYEDYEAFAKMKFGIENGNTYTQIFIDYAKMHGFEPQIKYYNNHTDLVEGLHNGEVDAIVANVMRASSDMKLLGKAGTAQYYYMYRKSDLELGDALNNALNQIEIDAPDYQASLVTKYFSIYDEDPFTKAELDYIKKLPVQKIGVWGDSKPLSYKDSKTGEITGITVDLLKKVSEACGLKFEYVMMERNHNNMVDFDEQNLNFMADVRNNDFNQLKYNGKLSISYMNTQAVLVSKKGKIPKGEGQTMAIPNCSNNLKEIIKESYPNFKFAFYSSVENAFKAVADGKADCVLATQYIVDYQLNKPIFDDLEAVPNSGYYEHFSLMWLDNEPDADQMLILSIINKAIKQVGDEEVQQSIIKYTTGMPYQLSNWEVCYKYRIPLIIIIILMLFIVIMVAKFMHARNQQLKLIKATNDELEKTNEKLSGAIAEANKASVAKSQFLAQMSHEIRTPMNAIIGLSTLIRSHLDDKDKTVDYLNKIDGSSKLLLGLINDILDMSAIESGKLKIDNAKYDFKHAISNVSSIFYQQATQKNIDFNVHMRGVTEEQIIGDELRVNQILMNLMSNAVKFTPSGGKIDFYVIQESMSGKKVQFRFIVSDTGCGMSEEMMARLFKPFEQESASTARKHGGSGLGMSIAKQLVEKMGGSIQVKSKIDEGTTFTVDIPFDACEQAKEPIDSIFGDIKVLIVDDDDDACVYCGEILERIGVKHDKAHSGEEALEMIGEADDKGDNYKMCLIDWKMPEMNGLELTQEIRNIFGNETIIVILTAYDLNEVEESGIRAGADYFMPKPLFQSTIYNAILKIINGESMIPVNNVQGSYDYSGKKVLIAEDVALNMEVIVNLLKMVKLDVVCAEDGREAVNLFKSNKDGTFDCILMDINMPILDGYEATKEIRNSDKKDAKTIPIYAMTANAFSSDITAAIDAGMNGHIAKPIETAVLYKTLESIFNENEEK